VKDRDKANVCHRTLFVGSDFFKGLKDSFEKDVIYNTFVVKCNRL